MYRDDTPDDPARAKVADEIEKTAKRQHLEGVRRDSFVDSASLCNHCKWAQIRRRASKNERRMECSVFSGPCPDDIQECTEYAGHASLSLAQMADIAIIIDSGERKRVGFQGN